MQFTIIARLFSFVKTFFNFFQVLFSTFLQLFYNLPILILEIHPFSLFGGSDTYFLRRHGSFIFSPNHSRCASQLQLAPSTPCFVGYRGTKTPHRGIFIKHSPASYTRQTPPKLTRCKSSPQPTQKGTQLGAFALYKGYKKDILGEVLTGFEPPQNYIFLLNGKDLI